MRPLLGTGGPLAALMITLSLSAAPPALAQSDGWIDGAPVRTRVRVGSDGETFVGVWVRAPQQTPARRARAPMTVSLVVDTSGSMAGDKIDSARMAAASLLESLAVGDIVSIYGFNNGVTELAPPTVLSAQSRSGLMRRLNMLYASGGTNLYGGVQAAVGRMAQAPSTHPVRRIFLISDGHANVGPADPTSLSNLAAGSTEHGTQITAIGVGLGYDQQTLSSMVVRSAGRLYHLRQPQQMATILERELDLLSRSVALNTVLEVTPAPGVTLLEPLTTGARLERGRLTLPLGAVYAGQEREVLFRARVDTRRAGERPLAEVRLRYQDPVEDAPRTQQARIAYGVTSESNAVASSAVPRVEAMVADHEATQAQRRAAALMREGRAEHAAVQLDAARRRLSQAAEAAPASPAASRLRERARRMGAASSQAQQARTAADQAAAGFAFEDEALSAEGY